MMDGHDDGPSRVYMFLFYTTHESNARVHLEKIFSL
jgi:hypothetical protein